MNLCRLSFDQNITSKILKGGQHPEELQRQAGAELSQATFKLRLAKAALPSQAARPPQIDLVPARYIFFVNA